MHSIAYKKYSPVYYHVPTPSPPPHPRRKYRHQGFMTPVIEGFLEVSSLTPLVVPASLIFAFLDSMW